MAPSAISAARMIFLFVIAGLDPAIHGAARLSDGFRKSSTHPTGYACYLADRLNKAEATPQTTANAAATMTI